MPGEPRPSAEAIIRVAGIIRRSVVDGPGLRTVLFVQGCPHGCPGCHNPESQPFEGGRDYSLEQLLEELSGPTALIRGYTLSGGEPFCQAGPLARLTEALKADGRDIVIYTGYTLEELLSMAADDEATAALLAAGDILVDGPYLEAERDLNLAFRGSRNQRILDLPTSLREGRAVEYVPAEY